MNALRRFWRRPPTAQLETAELTSIRAALQAGVSPSQAVIAVGGGVLAPVARAVRLGQTLAEEAQHVATGDRCADLLVRALGVAERAGTGGAQAVEQALTAMRDTASLERLILIRTAQARSTAKALTVMPFALWVVLVAVNGDSGSFYATPLGLATAAGAVALVAGGYLWARRLVRRAAEAADRCDPLEPPAPPRNLWRAAAAGVPVAVGLGVAAGPMVGVVAGAVLGFACSRPRVRRPEDRAPAAGRRGGRAGPTAGSAGGAAETAELLAIALSAGLPLSAAVEAVQPVSPSRARPALATAMRRLRGGWSADEAFADTNLADLGLVLVSAERWGSPAVEPLHHLAGELRDRRRATAEEAAERLQVALVFPTTLLTLPAFLLAVVPPMVWTAVRG